jgi:hypothetical protein
MTTQLWRITGTWKDDVMDGVAEIRYANGFHYVGQVSELKRHGFGAHTSNDGAVYMGMFDRDELHGDSFLLNPDGLKMAVTLDHGKFVRQTKGMFAEVVMVAVW